MKTQARLIVSAMAMIFAVALVFPPSASAAAVDGACSISGAGTISVGSSITFTYKNCSGNPQYGLVNLTAGSTLTVDSSDDSYSTWGLYQPAETDFTIGKAAAWCAQSWTGMHETICQVSRTGLWRLRVWSDSGSGSVIIAKVAAVPVNTRQFVGACSISQAPDAASRTWQYADGYCPAGAYAAQFWKLHLYGGDSVVMQVAKMTGVPQDLPWGYIYPKGTTDYTRATTQPICSKSYIGSATSFSCKVKSTGNYPLDAGPALKFRPIITHLVSNSVSMPRSVGRQRSFVVTDQLKSPAGVPAATCQLQVLAGRTWKPLKSVTAQAGRCTLRASFATSGQRKIRVKETGATGWSSAISRTGTVQVG